MRTIVLVGVLWLFLLLQARTVAGALLTNLGGVYAFKAESTEGVKNEDMRADDYSRAKALLSVALELDPTSGRGLYFLGKVYDRAAGGGGVSLLEQAVQVEPGNSLAWYALGNAYQERGDSDAAAGAWRHVPDLHWRHLLLGDEHAGARRWDLALAEYRLAVEIAPQSPEAKESLGQALVYGFARYDEGIAAYYDSVNLGNPNGYVWVEIAHALQMSGRLEEAASLIDEKGLTGYLADAILGSAYLQGGMVDKSVESYLSSLAQYPDNPWTLLGLGEAYSAGGQPTKAVEAWRRALEIDAGFAPARGALERTGAN